MHSAHDTQKIVQTKEGYLIIKPPPTAIRAWTNATIVRGKHPNLYRRSFNGHIVHKNSYGKGSPMGWRIKNGKIRTSIH